MEARLQPLLERLPTWHESGIDLKLFLPILLRDRTAGRISVRPCLEATLEWNEEALRRLLIQRFRVAGSRRIGLEDRAGPGLRGQLDTLILRSARGSPRRLLQIVNALLDAHLARDPEDPLFSAGGLGPNAPGVALRAPSTGSSRGSGFRNIRACVTI